MGQEQSIDAFRVTQRAPPSLSPRSFPDLQRDAQGFIIAYDGQDNRIAYSFVVLQKDRQLVSRLDYFVIGGNDNIPPAKDDPAAFTLRLGCLQTGLVGWSARRDLHHEQSMFWSRF